MSRELSGVIACLQEIELAVAELKTKASADWLEDLNSLSGIVRGFFQSPGRTAAEQVQAFLNKHRQRLDPWIDQPLHIDGLSTSLGALGNELTEVLEDLG